MMLKKEHHTKVVSWTRAKVLQDFHGPLIPGSEALHGRIFPVHCLRQ